MKSPLLINKALRVVCWAIISVYIIKIEFKYKKITQTNKAPGSDGEGDTEGRKYVKFKFIVAKRQGYIDSVSNQYYIYFKE